MKLQTPATQNVENWSTTQSVVIHSKHSMVGINNNPGLVFTNILILRIVLFLEFSQNFIESWEIF